MILKTLTHDRGNSDCWNFYDGITSASVYYNEGIERCCIAVRFEDEPGEITIAITESAYLCNDKGETIEKLGTFNSQSKISNKKSAPVGAERR